MQLLIPFSVLLYVSAAVARAPWSSKPSCLGDAEALDIATRWLALWDTTATEKSVVTSLSDLTSIIAPNIASYDDTYPPPIFGIQAFFDTVNAPGNYSTKDVKQAPLFVFHSCDQIAARWLETAHSTGYNSTVPAGTYVECKGIEILHVNLTTRLIYNATSSGDWLVLARELGQVNV